MGQRVCTALNMLQVLDCFWNLALPDEVGGCALFCVHNSPPEAAPPLTRSCTLTHTLEQDKRLQAAQSLVEELMQRQSEHAGGDAHPQHAPSTADSTTLPKPQRQELALKRCCPLMVGGRGLVLRCLIGNASL